MSSASFFAEESFFTTVDLKDGQADMTHMHDQASSPQSVSGTVKWFDPVKGFGFVVADEGGADILLHVNVLRNFGQSSIADGARVELLAQRTERGVQASEVLSIVPPLGGKPRW